MFDTNRPTFSFGRLEVSERVLQVCGSKYRKEREYHVRMSTSTYILILYDVIFRPPPRSHNTLSRGDLSSLFVHKRRSDVLAQKCFDNIKSGGSFFGLQFDSPQFDTHPFLCTLIASAHTSTNKSTHSSLYLSSTLCLFSRIILKRIDYYICHQHKKHV